MNRLSILDKAPYFDLCKCMPHDIMHVILEGVLPLSCKRLLLHCIYDEHYFTLKMLNRLILEFEYGYSESKNVPRQLDSDHLKSSDSKLSQSGMIRYIHNYYVNCHSKIFTSITDVALRSLASYDCRQVRT